MRIFQGCIEGREIAMTRQGMNTKDNKALTTVLVAKSAPTPPAPAPATIPPENLDMTPAEVAKTMKTVLSFDDVTKAFYVGLPEDAAVAFLAKSADEQKTEAHAAKTATDKVVAEAEAAKAGKTAAEVELQKRFDAQTAEIELLKADRVDRDIEKRAREEFDGFPGGVTAVVPLLKAYAGLPADVRKASEEVLKAQCTFAKTAGRNFGLTDEDVAKAMPATAELERKAADVSKSKGVDIQQARGLVMQDPANSALFDRVRAEEAQMARA